MDNKTASVIGAGIGGITTAIYLAKNGFSVDIYEKNGAPGGRCGQLIRDGHRFDLGATMLIMPGIYRRIFDSLGIPLFENENIKPLEELYKIFFDDNTVLNLTHNKIRLKEQLEAMESGSFEKAEEYIRKGYYLFDLGVYKLLNRNYYNLFQFTSFKNLGLLLKLKIFISNYRYAKKFFRNEHLRMAYTFQNIYVGQSPFTAPALYSMVPAAEMTEGSFSPAGGMFSVVDKMVKAAQESGVRFHYNSPVTEIRVEGNKVVSIVLADGKEIKTGIIVANADLPYVYRRLLPDKRKSAHIDRLTFSCSALCFHWGLDKVYPSLGQHNVFLSDSYREGLRAIFRDKTVGDHPSFYVHAPVRSDPSAAPPGYETLSVVVPCGHIDPMKKQDWDLLKKHVRMAVIRRLKQQGLTDIEDHITSEFCITPESWETTCNISRGSVFGSLAHKILQMGYFRPHNQHDKYKNLFFTGGSTHPGNGLPNVLLGARLTAERILNKKL